MNPQPKPSTPRDPKYLAWIRKQRSCISGALPPCEAHHTSTGGMGIKGSDYEAVPLTFLEHKAMDSKRKDDIPGLQGIIKRLRSAYEVEQENKKRIRCSGAL